MGRDDVDLRQRLLQHAREAGENALFGWIRAENAHDAYRLECYLWHAQGGAWASHRRGRAPAASRSGSRSSAAPTARSNGAEPPLP